MPDNFDPQTYTAIEEVKSKLDKLEKKMDLILEHFDLKPQPPAQGHSAMPRSVSKEPFSQFDF